MSTSPALSDALGATRGRPSLPGQWCGGGNCVEVADLPGGGLAIGDSKNPEQAPLLFTAAERAAFVADVKEEGLLG